MRSTRVLLVLEWAVGACVGGGQGARLHKRGRPVAGEDRVELQEAGVKGGLVEGVRLRPAARHVAACEPRTQPLRLLPHAHLVGTLRTAPRVSRATAGTARPRSPHMRMLGHGCP